MDSLKKKNQSLLSYLKNQFIYRLYKSTVPFMVINMRRKRKISVVFVVSQISYWKTETLYNEMREREEFDPILLLIPTPERESEFESAKEYMSRKSYPYETVQDDDTIWNKFRPDIIFYQQPYHGVIAPKYDYLRNLRSLFCYVPYTFHDVDDEYLIDMPLYNFCWQLYFENELTKRSASKLMYNRGKNIFITGFPFIESYLGGEIGNPWKNNAKKKIIWAPHYSLPDSWHMQCSTFLDYCDFMLEMTNKYKDKVHFAFKPHPSLESNLRRYWGEEKTKQYYGEWSSRENTQIETGAYAGLFVHSDAMIHDSMSFTIEYHYSHHPVMMLSNGNRESMLNSFAKEAYDLHYQGRTKDDIEHFILDVINDNDSMKQRRDDFYRERLLPSVRPSLAIIDSILG